MFSFLSMKSETFSKERVDDDNDDPSSIPSKQPLVFYSKHIYKILRTCRRSAQKEASTIKFFQLVFEKNMKMKSKEEQSISGRLQ